MAVDINMKDFGKRVKRINKRHRKMANGYVPTVNHDGLIVAKVRRSGPRFPWKGIALCFIAFFGFKGFLLSQLGEATYNARVVSLEQGTAIESFGGSVMSADPLTILISKQITAALH